METQSVDVDDLELPARETVKSHTLWPRYVPRPNHGDGIDEGAGLAAANIIRVLDKHYSREQVQAIADWVLFLSTQD